MGNEKIIILVLTIGLIATAFATISNNWKTTKLKKEVNSIKKLLTKGAAFTNVREILPSTKFESRLLRLKVEEVLQYLDEVKPSKHHADNLNKLFEVAKTTKSERDLSTLKGYLTYLNSTGIIDKTAEYFK